MATFRIDQVTPGAGTPGIARHDLIPGEIITLTATAPLGAGVTYTWEILDKVGGTAALSATTGVSVTIGNAGKVVRPCAFRVKLTADDNGVITEEELVCSVTCLETGLRLPLFAESSPQTGTLNANDPSKSTDNAIYTNRAGLGAPGQNWRGWAEWAYALTLVAEALAAGNLGSAGNSFVFKPGGVTSKNVFATWAALYAKASLIAGPVIVFIDDSITSPAVIPSGTYAVENWTFIGVSKLPSATALQFAQGSVLTGRYISMKNLAVTSTASSTSHILIGPGTNVTLELEAVSLVGAAAKKFITADSATNNTIIRLICKRGTVIGADAGFINAAGGQVIVELYGNSTVSQTAFSNTASGTVTLLWYSDALSSTLNGSVQSGFTGTISITRVASPQFFASYPIYQAIDAQQVGTTELLVGSVYLKAGTVILGDSNAMLGGGIAGDDTDLILRRFTGGTEICRWTTVNTTLGEVQVTGGDQTALAATDWYDIFLKAGSGGQTAILKGLRLNVRPSAANGL